MEQIKDYDKLSTEVSNLQNWLLYSGLSITDKNNENLGGVHAYFDEQNQNFGFLYPEITGYFISTLKFLAAHNKKEIQFAENSSNWLVNLYENYGGIIQSLDNKNHKLVYSFDTAICANGLLDCYDLTNNQKYLNTAKKLLDWISSKTLNSDGTLIPYFDIDSNQFLDSKEVWYKQSGCLHVKASIPFIHMYRITKDENFLKIGLKIADSVKHFRNDDGSIRLHLDEDTIQLHSLCYALEGLVHAYDVTKNKIYLEQCIESIKWCISKIENDGSIFLWHSSNNSNAKTSYHIAQLIRLIIIVEKIHSTTAFSYIEKLTSYLIQLQSDNSSKSSFGGFYEENFKTVFGWKKRLRVNSWGSMFALQALYWKDNFDKITFDCEAQLLF